MVFAGDDDAMRVVKDPAESEQMREDALRALSGASSAEAMNTLVQSLHDDDLGVRWVAARVLAEMGRRGLPALLSALTDPHGAANSWLREGAYHILRDNADAGVRMLSRNLLQALRGPAADLNTMREAERLRRVLGFPTTWPGLDA